MSNVLHKGERRWFSDISIKPILFAFFSEFLFVYAFYVSYFSQCEYNASMIAGLLVMMNLSNMLFNIPAGILADNVSRRNLLLIGLFAKIIFCGLCFSSKNYYVLLLAMSFYGIGNSCIYYHTEAYFYDELKRKNKEHIYPRFMGIYYAVVNLAIAIAGLFGETIYINFNFDGIFISSMLSLLVAVFLILQLPNYKPIRADNTVFGVRNSKHFIRLFRQILRKPNIIRIVILAILLDTLFVLSIDMNTNLMNTMEVKTGTISKIVGIVGLIRCITNYLSGRAVKYLSFKNVHSLLLIFLSLAIFFSFKGGYYMVLSISFYMCIYPFFDMVVKTKLQKKIDSATRATTMSFVSMLSFAFACIFNLCIMRISKIYGYYAVPVFVFLIIVLLLFAVRNIILLYRVDAKVRKTIKNY